MIKETVFTPKLAPDPQVILDSTSDLIVAIDKNYQLIYCNNSFRKNFEIFSNETLTNDKPLNEYLGLSRFSDLKTRWFGLLDKTFGGEKCKETIDYNIIGKKLIFTVDFTPIKRNNEVAYIQISARDETIRKNYEELLKKNKDIVECTDCNKADEEDKERIK
jgi:PAS domain-containing protein